MDLVSIVVPVYNMGDSLEKCVTSLVNQTYKSIEVILVDDGSKDNSLTVCNKLKEQDSRIKVYHTENRGSGPARNTGIENATGKYICFPDADDTYTEKAVEDMVLAMERFQSDFVVAGYTLISKCGKETRRIFSELTVDGETLRSNYHQYIGMSNAHAINGAPWNKLYSLDLIKEHNVCFPPLRRHQDTGFISRYLCYAKRVSFIRNVVYYHYTNDLRTEWYKYPENYIDSVIGLREVYKQTVFEWNPSNSEVKQRLDKVYICSVIKAMELLFSPRSKHSRNQREALVKSYIAKSHICKMHLSSKLDAYHRLVMRLLKSEHFKLALAVMRVKIEAEKHGLLT